MGEGRKEGRKESNHRHKWPGAGSREGRRMMRDGGEKRRGEERTREVGKGRQKKKKKRISLHGACRRDERERGGRMRRKGGEERKKGRGE